MRTSTPVSTISYNTDNFLIENLNKFIDDRIIEFWAFINHLPEEDEKKVHKHLYVIPNGLIDTIRLQNLLQEFDLNNPEALPLGCIRFVHSKFADWFLYAVHDRDYLASKSESRKYHYQKEEIYCSDLDYFSELIHTSDFSKWKTFAKFRDSVQSGVSFKELFANGFVPVQQIIQWKKAYNLMVYGDMDYTDRGGRQGHESVSGGGFEGALYEPQKTAPSKQGGLLHDIDEVITSDGEIHTMYSVYDISLPFTDNLES